MSEKHTPGPWTIRREDGDRYLEAPANSAKYTTLMCDTQYYPWTPDSEADWSLISAAPELLEAANLALAGLMQPKAVDFEILEEKLRVAIAKAEGK